MIVAYTEMWLVYGEIAQFIHFPTTQVPLMKLEVYDDWLVVILGVAYDTCFTYEAGGWEGNTEFILHEVFNISQIQD
mgnify:CR=1 FL=1